MASNIYLTFSGWESGSNIGATINFKVNGVDKNLTVVALRTGPGQMTTASDNYSAAVNFRNAWQADYAGGFHTVAIAGSSQVAITATNLPGAVFSDFVNSNGKVSEAISNEPYDPPFNILTAVASEGSSNKCSQVRVTLTVEFGTAPYIWVNPSAGTGLFAQVNRSGSIITIEIEDGNENTDTIDIFIPDQFTVGDITGVQVIGNTNGVTATVSATVVAKTGLTYEYSLTGGSYQSSNVFPSVVEGSYTLYVRDNFGCVVTYPFTVELASLRPPAYAEVPLSNSFGWYEQQSLPNGSTVPYNGRNVQPGNYKPIRWSGGSYCQPWLLVDVVTSQFRSNYDTLLAEILDLDGNVIDTYSITQMSSNIGNRKILDAKIFDRGSSQTGVYFTTGNEYDSMGNIIDSHALNGELPDWARVGQKFTITNSDQDGIYEIKQIIFDSTLLVNALVIDRLYVEASEPHNIITDAVYNVVNYETHEFEAVFSGLTEGKYQIRLTMSDSEDEYPTRIWYTTPLSIGASIHALSGAYAITLSSGAVVSDLVHIRYGIHENDGIDYSTGIRHQQRVLGLFYEEEPGFEAVTHDDSKKELIKLDGRVNMYRVLSVEFVPYWVQEKINLAMSKEEIYVDGVEVQFDSPFERETYPKYNRVSLKAKAKIQNYEQYLTSSFDLL